MGVYGTFGKNNTRIKLGERPLHHYEIDDEVDIPDGIYVGHEGIVVIKDAEFVAEFDRIFDKWGGVVAVDIQEQNPVGIAVKELAAERESQS